jgi:hypothetical protein
MKTKRRVGLLALVCAVFLCALAAAACAQVEDVFTLSGLPEDEQVQLGTYYNLPDVFVTETGTAVNVSAADPDGTAVTIENARIHIAKFGEYSVRYFAEVGKTTLSHTQKLTAVDDFEPLITIGAYKMTAAAGSAFTLPEIGAVGTMGESITPIVKVFTDLDDPDSEVTLADNAFVLGGADTYYIRVQATSATSGKTAAKYVEVYVRGVNELESADRAEFLQDWTPRVYTSFGFNDRADYIKSGEGSYHFTSEYWNTGNGHPAIRLDASIVTDFTDITSFSFWLYNDGAGAIDIETLAGGGSAFFARDVKPGMWTKVELTKAQFAALSSWSGGVYDMENVSGITFMFASASRDFIDVYLDDVRVNYGTVPAASYASAEELAPAGVEYSVLAPATSGFTAPAPAVTYKVFNGTEPVALTDEKFTPSTPGDVYTVIAEATDDDGKQAQARYNVVTVTPAPANALIANYDVAFVTSNATGTKVTRGDNCVDMYVGGYNQANAMAIFDARMSDISSYAYLSVTMKNLSASTAAKVYLGNDAAAKVIPDAFLPVSSEWSTTLVPLGALGYSNLADLPTYQTHPDTFQIALSGYYGAGNNLFFGHVLFKDFLLLTDAEAGALTGEAGGATFADDIPAYIPVGTAHTFPAFSGSGYTQTVSLLAADGSAQTLSGSSATFDEAGVKTILMQETKDTINYFKYYNLSVAAAPAANALIANFQRPNVYSNPGAMSCAVTAEYLTFASNGGYDSTHLLAQWKAANYLNGYTANLSANAYFSITVKKGGDQALKLKIGIGTFINVAIAADDNDWHTYVIKLSDMYANPANATEFNIQLEGYQNGTTRYNGSVSVKDMLLLTGADFPVYGTYAFSAPIGQAYTLPSVTLAGSATEYALYDGAGVKSVLTPDANGKVTLDGADRIVKLVIKTTLNGKTYMFVKDLLVYDTVDGDIQDLFTVSGTTTINVSTNYLPIGKQLVDDPLNFRSVQFNFSWSGGQDIRAFTINKDAATWDTITFSAKVVPTRSDTFNIDQFSGKIYNSDDYSDAATPIATVAGVGSGTVDNPEYPTNTWVTVTLNKSQLNLDSGTGLYRFYVGKYAANDYKMYIDHIVFSTAA